MSNQIPMLKDLDTGTLVAIICPSAFELKTQLVLSCCYQYEGKEARFLQWEARKVGLPVEKPMKPLDLWDESSTVQVP